ncbi:2-oxoglutarate-dependent dioxygenase htyE-like isoform X2 [Pomacea canaliculata]|nr:2-oxoglutarate-dependent dioxygenase htyE-like isoform X2 [Pomacea canaliculata]
MNSQQFMIPAVDIKCVAEPNEEKAIPVCDESLLKATKQIHDTFRDYGFCYLTNHGIPTSIVNDIFSSSRAFFELPVSIKQRYARPIETNHGWAACERESLNPERPYADMKESFNFSPCDNGQWPKEVPEMRNHFVQFYDCCYTLTKQVLRLLSLALEIKDLDYVVNCHKLIGQKGNYTTLRSLYYPSVGKDLKEGQIQCGEHSDYGTITLLFQDNTGGLQVLGKDGLYHDVTPLPDAVLVNIGDLMQRWTADKYPATKHRVIVPEQALKEGRSRQSLAFFVHPDDSTLISCLDGS